MPTETDAIKANEKQININKQHFVTINEGLRLCEYSIEANIFPARKKKSTSTKYIQ